ncbi:uncharacterized protein LOC126265848 [Aethina tumida]|uniref:uncharacterized protein LOC126265848 n=1 Tax=Aethina tumida TaxID=116153 RepID=UPI00214828A0|nr:uncharacterized protein LOC126265848 [Aethina tumida]XP_049824690.1 uncharacterized protein LOC126265848 [Aethina tumida]
MFRLPTTFQALPVSTMPALIVEIMQRLTEARSDINLSNCFLPFVVRCDVPAPFLAAFLGLRRETETDLTGRFFLKRASDYFAAPPPSQRRSTRNVGFPTSVHRQLPCRSFIVYTES